MLGAICDLARMDEPFNPQWRPEPEPQNALERLLPRAAQDPALHGQLMRTLWEAEISTLMPYHPEMMGTHEVQNGDSMQLMIFQDDEGSFVPAFSSESVAEYCLQKQVPDRGPIGVATMPGELFFRVAAGTGQRVLINSGMAATLVLRPEALAALVQGELRHSRPSTGPGETMQLFSVDETSLPPALRDGIRAFCDARRVPIAVYLFLPADPATGKPHLRELRAVLRLRSLDNDFYNDFTLMAGKLVPPGLELSCAVVTPDNTAALEFLQRCRPLWPVLPEE